MHKLWAPWRKTYILRKSVRGCFICQIRRSRKDSRHFILQRSSHSFAVLNLFPYNPGHILIVPNRHIKEFDRLNNEELLDFFRLTNDMVKRVRRNLKPHGINMGVNLGRIAGAGVPGHVHMHIVPRWLGDSNFMPTIADTKVVSESLKSIYRRLSV